MSLFTAIDVAATSLEAQSVRLNTISSNLANANTVSSSDAEAYRAQYPVFETIYNEMTANGEGASAGVQVTEIVQSELPDDLLPMLPGEFFVTLADDLFFGC